MTTLAEIRSKLLTQQQKSEGSKNGYDNAVFPFWDAQTGGTTVLRFLPDADPNNTFFWIERLVIKLPFQGVKGEHDREVMVQVPCMEMYGETCPILAETRPWWKDDSLKDLARRYWKKKSYLFQGFVVKSDLEEKSVPENPIRRFVINSGIYDIIKASLMDPDMEDMPVDYTSGRDFNLKKSAKGEYANYSTSSWAMKTRALNSLELDAINQYGLFNLKDFLPKKPTAEEQNAIKEMFKASVEDEAYDPERWANFYKPFGSYSSNETVSNDTVVSRVSAPVKEAEVVTLPKTVTPVTNSGRADASEILRRIKERNINQG